MNKPIHSEAGADSPPPGAMQVTLEPFSPVSTAPSKTPAPEADLNDGPSQPKPDGPKRSDPFQFGSRFLLPGDDVFDYNAWDHVEVDEEYKEYTREQIEKQRQRPVSEFDRGRFMKDPAKWWDLFYKNNRENFFKNRKWLRQEFPIIADALKEDAPPTKVVEVGCGAGNTLFPILTENKNPNFHIHGCDFSAKAVSLVQSQPMYLEQNPLGAVSASVYDLSVPDALPEGIEPGSVDVVFMVFVFSALAPTQWSCALKNVRRMLKKGGKVLFRDYGRGDLAQVRFKAGRYLEDNFYVRGDGTRVYFFDETELMRIFTGASADPDTLDDREDYGGFTMEHFGVDKRLLVNRKRQIKMYRRWLQAVFEKL